MPKACVVQQAASRVLTHFVWVVFHLWLLIKHDAGRLHDELHTRRRVLQAADFHDVVPAQVLEAGQSGVQRGQGGIQLTLCIVCKCKQQAKACELDLQLDSK